MAMIASSHHTRLCLGWIGPLHLSRVSRDEQLPLTSFHSNAGLFAPRLYMVGMNPSMPRALSFGSERNDFVPPKEPAATSFHLEYETLAARYQSLGVDAREKKGSRGTEAREVCPI